VPVSISGSPPAGGVGEPYSFTFGTTGTPAPTVTRTAGQLPPGLSLSTAGVLSGTPKTSGFSVFTVQADNGVDPVKTDDVTMFIGSRPTISVLDAGMPEGNSGTHGLTFEALLSWPSTVPVTVHWETRNGTATAGSDYTASAGNLTFLPGDMFATFTVPVKGDRVREPNERFYISLSRPLHANLPGYRGIGTIRNDD
jgi:hypothetical protein